MGHRHPSFLSLSLVSLSLVWIGPPLTSSAAAVPAVLTHHGLLTQGGNPISGSVAVSFTLYDGQSNPLPLWSEDLSVECASGRYQVTLGLVTPLPVEALAEATDHWLGLDVAGVPLEPRLRVTSVPFALAAAQAEVARDLDCEGCIGGPEVAFGYAGSSAPGGPALDIACSQSCVSAAELDNGAVVTAKLADGAVTTAKLAACPAGQVLRATGSAWQCTSAVHIADNGDVGIGTTSPAARLDVAGEIRGELPYYFYGAFATPTEWMADAIYNQNYARFCQAMNRTYVRSTTLQSHYTIARGNGYFYDGWYYVGLRYCASDTHVYGAGDPANPYNVWRYNAGCGCCIDQGSGSSNIWSFETAALVWCRW